MGRRAIPGGSSLEASSLTSWPRPSPVSVALRGAVSEMAAVFEKRSGHTIKMTVAAPGEIVAALQAGRHADVVVVTNGALTELENKGLVRRGRVSLATTGFGLATRSGDLAPDISTD